MGSQRLGLLGTAVTSSQGVVLDDELSLTPAYRPAALLETVSGLTVTSHSGEGKANQYLMRGFNLDHGTDLAVFVDGMPINEPTHAHGQGYTDLNFMIPELISGLTYTKGPYFADVGDFASVASIHISYLDSIADQLSASLGTLRYRRMFGAGSVAVAAGNLQGAVEAQHYDGPWVSPDDERKVNAVLRYVGGRDDLGISVTGMFYHNQWNATTDQPERAMEEGLISRFGSLDPSDGGQAQRTSLSSQFHAADDSGTFTANAYLISNHLTLWNNFTHFLIDPVHGDQEAQHEDRATFGGGAAYARKALWLGINHTFVGGLQLRNDSISVSRLPTQARRPLPPSDEPLGFSESDQVHLSSTGLYAQATSLWTYWLRTVVGVREDFVHESDTGTNAGTEGANLFQPKASVIFTPLPTTELYLSAGRGFHTDDARGVNQAVLTRQGGAPLIGASNGAEVGLRQQFGERIAATFTVFRLNFASETTYDPDVGQDSAGPASRRVGGEVNVTYKALRWLELSSTISAARARFTTSYDDGTGHIGTYIPDSPNLIGSFSGYIKNLGHWSGAVELRFLGSHPLTPDDAVVGDGYAEWNADVHYAFDRDWFIGLGLYNLFNTHANAAEYWYVDRLAGEPAAGIAGVHIHPLEPFTARLTLARSL